MNRFPSFYDRRPHYRAPVRIVDDLAMRALAETDPQAAASLMRADRTMGMVFTFVFLGIFAAVAIAIAVSASKAPPTPTKEEKKSITQSFYD